MARDYFRYDALGPTNLGAFKLTHMAKERYPDGQELRHNVVGPPANELIHTVSGHGRVLVEADGSERWVEVGPGTYLICDERSRRAICGVRDWRLDWYDFHYEDAAYLPRHRALRLTRDGPEPAGFEALSALFRSGSLWGRREASALFAALVMRLASGAAAGGAGASPPGDEGGDAAETPLPGAVGADPALAVQRVLDVLNADLSRCYAVEEMAGLAGMSASVFRKQFLRVMGVPPKTHYDRLRMDEALRRLAAGEKVKDVARAVGFSDPFHFSRSFRRLRGSSPRSIRRGFLQQRDRA